MKRGIRKKEGEDFSNLERVIELLNSDNPITKKVACEMLNISYNTSRLQKIIDEYIEQKEHIKRRRAELRTKALSKDEISTIITTYLETGNLSEISETTFRSLSAIKKVLKDYNIPLRNSSNTYSSPIELDPKTISSNYTKDDLVYSARYDQAALISKLIKRDALGDIYRIWLTKDCQYAYQPYYELSDLRAVQNSLGIKIITRKFLEVNKNGDDPLIMDINRALEKAKKRKKDE